MVILVKLFGIVMVVFGVAFLVGQDLYKKYISFWIKGKRLYTGGIISILIGIILLVAASQCRIVWFVILMGILALIKGIVLLVLGPTKMASRINWWRARPPLVLRLLALLALAIGALLIYCA